MIGPSFKWGQALSRGVVRGPGKLSRGYGGLSLVSGGVEALGKAAIQGTQFTHPVGYGVKTHGYGKRGIDANNLNTQGLVQGLHSSRRKMR